MDDAALRTEIERWLTGGLETASADRTQSSAQVDSLCRRLRGLPADDIAARLVLAGFSLQAHVAADEDAIEQSCATCMYFERHRRFCGLPELMLPVDPAWSCVLWRI